MKTNNELKKMDANDNSLLELTKVRVIDTIQENTNKTINRNNSSSKCATFSESENGLLASTELLFSEIEKLESHLTEFETKNKKSFKTYNQVLTKISKQLIYPQNEEESKRMGKLYMIGKAAEEKYRCQIIKAKKLYCYQFKEFLKLFISSVEQRSNPQSKGWIRESSEDLLDVFADLLKTYRDVAGDVEYLYIISLIKPEIYKKLDCHFNKEHTKTV
jgi:hypothetical protein